MRAPPSIERRRSGRRPPEVGPRRNAARRSAHSVSPPITRSGVHASTSSSSLPVLTTQSASGTWSVSPPLVSQTSADGADAQALARPHGEHRVGVGVARTRRSCRSTPSAPSSAASRADRLGASRFWVAAVEVAGREDHAGEPKRRAVRREQLPDERVVLVHGRDVADARPVVGAVREGAGEHVAGGDDSRLEDTERPAVPERVHEGSLGGDLQDERDAGQDPPACESGPEASMPSSALDRSWPAQARGRRGPRAADRGVRFGDGGPGAGIQRTTRFAVAPNGLRSDAGPAMSIERRGQLVRPPDSRRPTQSQTVTTATPSEPMEARIADEDGGQHDIEDVRDANGIAGTDDLDRGLRQRRFPGPDRELR